MSAIEESRVFEQAGQLVRGERLSALRALVEGRRTISARKVMAIVESLEQSDRKLAVLLRDLLRR